MNRSDVARENALKRWEGRAHEVIDPNDLCGEPGAKRLASALNAYWRERGFEANARVVPVGFSPVMRSARWDIRSDTINGIPTRRAA